MSLSEDLQLSESSNSDSDKSEPPPEGEFEVESIIDKRIGKDGEVQYKVRWKDYPPDQDTWEPRSNLEHCALMIELFEKHRSYVQTDHEMSDDDNNNKKHKLRDGGYFLDMYDVLERKGKGFTPLPNRRPKPAVCLNEKYLLDKSLGGRSAALTSLDSSSDDDDDEKFNFVSHRSRSSLKRRPIKRQSETPTKFSRIVSSSESENSDEESTAATPRSGNSSRVSKKCSSKEGWTAVAEVDKTLHRASAEFPSVQHTDSCADVPTANNFSAQRSSSIGDVSKSEVENLAAKAKTLTKRLCTVAAAHATTSKTVKKDWQKNFANCFIKRSAETQITPRPRSSAAATDPKPEISRQIIKEFAENFEKVENKTHPSLQARLKAIADGLERTLARYDSYVWSIAYLPTKEESLFVRRQFQNAIMTKNVEKVDEMLKHYRAYELGLKNTFDCTAESLINKKRKFFVDGREKERLNLKFRRLDEHQSDRNKNNVDRCEKNQNDLVKSLPARVDFNNLPKIQKKNVCSTPQSSASSSCTKMKPSSASPTPKRSASSSSQILLPTNDDTAYKIENRRLSLPLPDRRPLLSENLLKCHLKKGFKEMSASCGRHHPLCKGTVSMRERFRQKMINYVSKSVEIFTFDTPREFLMNVTAKVTKSARQHGAVNFEHFASEQMRDGYMPPRFSVTERQAYKPFNSPFDRNDKRKVTADADELTVDLKFLNKHLLESVYEQEIENNQCNESVDGNFVTVRNIEAVYMFQIQSPYGDISNTIRDMVSRKVSKELKTVAQCTPLARLILQCYKERGPEQEHKKLPYRKMLQIMYEIVDADGNTNWSELPPLPKDTAPLPPPPPPPPVMLENYLESPPSVVSDNASLPDAVILNSELYSTSIGGV